METEAKTPKKSKAVTKPWLDAVRDANLAVVEVYQALAEAFPDGSRWGYDGHMVRVCGIDQRAVGNVWVTLVNVPTWQRSVYAGELKSVPEDADGTPVE